MGRSLAQEEIWGERCLNLVNQEFKKIQDPRLFKKKSKITFQDCLMSCFAIFNLKWPSLLQYAKNIQKKTLRDNLHSVYSIQTPPSDTYMRERLDELDPQQLSPTFKRLFSLLQRNKILENYTFLHGAYLVSIDGTGHFSSDKVHCSNCCVKNHKDGKKSYYHQLLGAVLLHPNQKAVIPLYPEAICKEDGSKKNDCERNAAKRLLAQIRADHPHLKLIIVEDALASNAPHILELQRHKMDYILGVKEGDHAFLFDWVKHEKMKAYSYKDERGCLHQFEYINQVPLNDSYFDLKVNFLKYEEIDPNGRRRCFSWITNITISDNNVTQIMKGGRARWLIENETFNTLKNQGYEFEHNFGHGNKNLCTIMATLMMLAFAMDQVQLLCCQLYKKAKEISNTFKSFCEKIRCIIDLIPLQRYKEIYQYITYEIPLNSS